MGGVSTLNNRANIPLDQIRWDQQVHDSERKQPTAQQEPMVKVSASSFDLINFVYLYLGK